MEQIPHPLRLAPAVLLMTTLMAVCWAASATTYVQMTDAELVDRAPVVAEGRVVAIETVSSDAAMGSPAVSYRFEVRSVLKGLVAEQNLIVRVPGGVRPDGVGLKIWGAPRFAVGDEALLFLNPRRDGTHTLHQLMLGVFHIRHQAGRAVVVRDLEEAVEVDDLGLSVPREKSADGGARDLAAFRSWLQDRLRGARRRADYHLAETQLSNRQKFALITSAEEPPPLGCGSTGGHPVRWFADRTPWPIPWRYHTEGQPGLFVGGLFDFQAAIESWADDPNTPVRYLHIGRTNATNGFLRRDNINSVIFGDPNDEIGGSFIDSGVLAIGGPWFLCDVKSYADDEFHPIVEADIVIQDGAEIFFDTTEDPSTAARELFAHELGHTLGLAHSVHAEALMTATIHADRRGASHAVDDLSAAYFLYGRPAAAVDTDGPDAAAIEKPEEPSDLAASLMDHTGVLLEWSDNSNRESNVLIERRGEGELNFRFVATVASGHEEYLDVVKPEASYTYRVMAQNAAGRSRPSPLVRLDVPEDPRPNPPSFLRTAATSKNSIRLNWQDNSDDESTFAIELLRGNAWIELPFEVPLNNTAVDFFGFTPGQAFSFRMMARNSFGDSEVSNVSTSTTFASNNLCFTRDQRLCLKMGDYVVDVVFVDPGSGLEVSATVEPITDQASLYWFFDETNPELMIRAFDLPDGETRIAFSGLSDVGYRVTVTDTRTDEVSEHLGPAGRSCAAPGATSSVSAIETGVTVPCRADDETLCLEDGRFAASLTWFDPADAGAAKAARVVAGPGNIGLFSFAVSSQPDVLFKLLDGDDINGHFWVYASVPFDDISYELRVLDTLNGTERFYRHAAGSECGVADTAAFAR